MKPKKPRILVIAACPFPANRGTPSRILRMAESLLEEYRIDVLTYPISEDIDYDPRLSIHRVGNLFGYDKLSPGPSFTKIYFDLKMVVKLQELDRRHDYDIVYAHHVEGCAIGLFWKRFFFKDTELVYDVHAKLTEELADFRFFFNRLSAPFWGYVENLLVSGTDKLVCVSEELKWDLLHTGLADERDLIVIPTGIRYNKFREMMDDRPPFDHRGLKITYAGSMAPYQNLTELPAVVSNVIERYDSARFYIIAGKVDEDNVRAVEDRVFDQDVADHVEILTEVNFQEIPSYLRHSDILINLRTECSGVPQKLVNYMATGRPIVSASGSGKQLKDGENALVVDNHDTEAFADAIISLLSDPETGAELGRRAGKDAKKYDWDPLSDDLHMFLK